MCVYVYICCTHLNPAMRKKLVTTASGMAKWKRRLHHPLEDSAAANGAMSVVIVSSTPSTLLFIRGNRGPGGYGRAKSGEVGPRGFTHLPVLKSPTKCKNSLLKSLGIFGGCVCLFVFAACKFVIKMIYVAQSSLSTVFY